MVVVPEPVRQRRRPQVVGFYNQQYLTAAGIASSGLSDTLSAAAIFCPAAVAGFWMMMRLRDALAAASCCDVPPAVIAPLRSRRSNVDWPQVDACFWRNAWRNRMRVATPPTA